MGVLEERLEVQEESLKKELQGPWRLLSVVAQSEPRSKPIIILWISKSEYNDHLRLFEASLSAIT